MSHYTLLVTGDNVEEQLEPFSELIEVEEYGELWTEEDKRGFIDYYTDPSSKGYHPDNEQFVSDGAVDLEGLYALKGEDWDGGRCRLNEDGEWMCYSTYNPDSKWDWYQVGGRWSGMLQLKDGAEGEMGERSWSNEDAVIPKNTVDSACVDDVDWDTMQHDPETFDRSCRFWELIVEGADLKEGEEMPFNMMKAEYYTERYGDKVTYAKAQCGFGTFAVLHKGVWYEKGQMGWFGCSSESHKEGLDWDLYYYDHFIKPLLGTGVRITIVDCHI